jgi:MSHA pilin protein MshA
MMRIQRGFTLIELVMVIVLIGVLAAIAVPKFIDLSADANTAAVKGVAGSLNSASSINYAARKANSSKGAAVDNCDDGGSLLQGGLPTGYTITAGAVAADATASCTVTGVGSATATFTILGIN